MRERLSRAGCAALVALGILGFNASVARADSDTPIVGTVTAKATPTPSSLLAPLWVYPSSGGAPPIMVVPSAPGGPQVLVIREEPSLLTPADLHFSTDQENGVTVVRGPMAR